MRSGKVWRCAVCNCTRGAGNRARARAGAPPLASDAIACGQACALALVESEIAGAEAQIQAHAGKLGITEGQPRPGSPPRRAAYVHVLSYPMRRVV